MRLVREWRGKVHVVTIGEDGDPLEGRGIGSLSEVARAITGTHWSGPAFFGLKRKARGMNNGPLRDLHPQVERGGAGAGVQQPRCAARGVRRLYPQPGQRRLDRAARYLRRWRPVGRDARAALPCSGCWPTSPQGTSRHHRRLQGRPPDPLAARLLQAGRGVRQGGHSVRVGDPVVQHHHQHGPAHPQHAALVRAVRARGHRRAHPRQDRRIQGQGHVDGRHAAARLRARRAQPRDRRGACRDRPRHL